MVGKLDEALEALLAAALMARECRADAVEARILNLTGVIHWIGGDLQRALALFRASATAARRTGDLWQAARAAANEGIVHGDQERSAEALEAFTAAASDAIRVGDIRAQAMVHSYTGVVLLESDRTEAAIEELERSIQLFDEVGDLYRRALSRGYVGWMLATTGRVAEAEACVVTALDYVDANRGDRHRAMLRASLALLRRGSNADEAEALLADTAESTLLLGDPVVTAVVATFAAAMDLDDCIESPSPLPQSAELRFAKRVVAGCLAM